MATKHKVVSREEWISARIALLEEEKELTRKGDEVARKRQELPWVKIEKAYEFKSDNGTETLKSLFRGRSQLIVYHFMLGPDYEAGCPSCSSIADGFNGIVTHLANHDVMLWAISRAPLEKIRAFKKRMGWTFPWASSFESDFNFDYHVAFTEDQQLEGKIVYNFRQEPAWPKEQGDNILSRMDGTPVADTAAVTGTDAATFTRDRPGMSAFVLEDGEIYNTYCAHSRGLDAMWSIYPWLDRAPKGRNETGVWIKHRDSYDKDELVRIGGCCNE